jgi:Uma2 family endonuclease
VLLLVEVPESSLAEDRGEKRELYAEALIGDYWIVNLLDRTIEIYRQPSNGVYLWTQVFGPGEVATPLALPDEALAVDYLFAT